MLPTNTDADANAGAATDASDAADAADALTLLMLMLVLMLLVLLMLLMLLMPLMLMMPLMLLMLLILMLVLMLLMPKLVLMLLLLLAHAGVTNADAGADADADAGADANHTDILMNSADPDAGAEQMLLVPSLAAGKVRQPRASDAVARRSGAHRTPRQQPRPGVHVLGVPRAATGALWLGLGFT